MPRCIIDTHSTMNFLILQSGIISPMLLQAACNSCFLASRKPLRKCYMFYSTRNGAQDARKSDIYAKKNQQSIFKYFYGVKNAEAVYAVHAECFLQSQNFSLAIPTNFYFYQWMQV